MSSRHTTFADDHHLVNEVLSGSATCEEESDRALTQELAARAALTELPIGGVLPDIPGPLAAHCRGWHAVTALPLTLPCCGVVLFRRDDPCHHAD